MSVGEFVDFKQNGRVEEFEGGRLEWKALILNSIFGAINRSREQPTTVKTNLSSSQFIPTIKR